MTFGGSRVSQKKNRQVSKKKNKRPSFTAILSTVSEFLFFCQICHIPANRNLLGWEYLLALRRSPPVQVSPQRFPKEVLKRKAADGESPFPAAENRSSIGAKPAARKTCGSVHLATFFSESFQNALKVCKDLMFPFCLNTLFRNGHFNPNIVGPGLALSGFWCNDSASLEIDCMFCLFNDPGGQRKQRGN